MLTKKKIKFFVLKKKCLKNALAQVFFTCLPVRNSNKKIVKNK